MTSKSHQCDACGGTGGSTITIAYGDVLPGDRIWNRYGYSWSRGHWTEVLSVTCDGPQHGLATRDGYSQWGYSREGVGVRRSCPVCLGAGVFSDVMPVSDSLADAETYRNVAWSKPQAVGVTLVFDLDWTADDVAWTAERDARAAFRAVPGLRG